MNINEFDFADSPFEATLVYEMDTKNDLDREALEIIGSSGSMFAATEVSGKEVCFDISNKMSLKKYLGNVLTKGDSLNLIATIVEAYGIVAQAGIKRDNLLIDVDLITVDYDTREVSLVYLPVKTHGLRIKSLRAFLKEVLVNTIYDETDNLEFVGQLITYINTHKDIDAGNLLDFLDSFAGSSAPSAAPQYQEEEVYVAPAAPAAPEPVFEEPQITPYIFREKTQEKILIEKAEFMVGKIAGIADCLLTDNPTVSRMHAIIKHINDAYYVCDNYSTNSTFLNGEKLEPGKDYVLLNGAKISFANEKFTFFDR